MTLLSQVKDVHVQVAIASFVRRKIQECLVFLVLPHFFGFLVEICCRTTVFKNETMMDEKSDVNVEGRLFSPTSNDQTFDVLGRREAAAGRLLRRKQVREQNRDRNGQTGSDVTVDVVTEM